MRRRDMSLWSPVVLAIVALGVGVVIGKPSIFGKTLFAAAPTTATATAPASPTAVTQLLTTPTASATAAPSSSPTVAPSATPESTVTPTPSGAIATSSGTVHHIGIQAGHWQESSMPDELASLRTSTGAVGPGWTEQAFNLDVARRAAKLLESSGFKVDVLPSTIPEGYQADVFVAIHADANSDPSQSGFKVARSARSAIPATDDALVSTIYRDYGRITGLPRNDGTITNNMRYYYAFASKRIKHSVAPTTPAAILETGFLTNQRDRTLLLGSPDLIAQAVATSIKDFLSR